MASVENHHKGLQNKDLQLNRPCCGWVVFDVRHNLNCTSHTHVDVLGTNHSAMASIGRRVCLRQLVQRNTFMQHSVLDAVSTSFQTIPLTQVSSILVGAIWSNVLSTTSFMPICSRLGCLYDPASRLISYADLSSKYLGLYLNISWCGQS